ncbi:MAG TPA: hypothetical protein VGH03_00930 [Caulobacteraceae bacterium]
MVVAWGCFDRGLGAEFSELAAEPGGAAMRADTNTGTGYPRPESSVG